KPSIAAALGGAVLGYRAFSGYCPVYGALGLSTADDAEGGAAISVAYGKGVRVEYSVVIGRPVEQVYRFWRDFENLPRFIGHLDSVRALSERRSRWRAKAPLGRTVEWDAEIVEDRPNERIAWRSLEGADVDNAGSVAFERAPGGRGTVVRVELRYDPPGGGLIGATIARLFGKEPGQEVQEDLRAFKQVMETGEVVRSEATAQGGGPARPPARARPDAATA
ncbi:MAG TPA: SRPBCC family protein, partial [Microvirga sp.]|nr:SRPBCC family protein [Microvirga sp.]